MHLDRRSLLIHLPLLALTFALTIATANLATGQQPSPASPTAKPSPNLAGIAHVALRVKDLDASVAFYQKLGFVQAFALSRDGKVYEAFIKINDRQFIELYPSAPDHPEASFLHVCFEGGDLQSVHDFYIAAGLKPNAVRTAGAGNLLFTMPGPASPTGAQNMEYTQYMPASMHSKDVGMHLGADRIATSLIGVTIAVDDPAGARAFYLDKAGFVPKSADTIALPGAPQESLTLVPSSSLGLRSRIVFAIKDMREVKATLKKRGIPFDQEGKSLRLTDPDGNQNLLAIQ